MVRVGSPLPRTWEKDKLAEVVRDAKRLEDLISLIPDGPAKKLKTGAIQRSVKEKYPRGYLDVVDPEEDVLATHVNAIVKEVNQLRQEVAEN